MSLQHDPPGAILKMLKTLRDVKILGFIRKLEKENR